MCGDAGHSTTTLVHVHGGGTGSAYLGSQFYNVTWMVRNEDFFFLRWARPKFVRAHILRNSGAFIAGYAVCDTLCVTRSCFS